MTVSQTIQEKLQEAFIPTHLEVINMSHLHAGHKGSPETGESHFKVVIAAQAFKGLSQVQAHRKIYQVLENELQGSVHALSLVILAPKENDRAANAPKGAAP